MKYPLFFIVIAIGYIIAFFSFGHVLNLLAGLGAIGLALYLLVQRMSADGG